MASFSAGLSLLFVIALGTTRVRRGHGGNQRLETRYTKHEFRIPMRDGVRLFTAVYAPKDASQSYPFLITRTPFGIAPYGESEYPDRLGPAEGFERAGYWDARVNCYRNWVAYGRR